MTPEHQELVDQLRRSHSARFWPVDVSHEKVAQAIEQLSNALDDAGIIQRAIEVDNRLARDSVSALALKVSELMLICHE